MWSSNPPKRLETGRLCLQIKEWPRETHTRSILRRSLMGEKTGAFLSRKTLMNIWNSSKLNKRLRRSLTAQLPEKRVKLHWPFSFVNVLVSISLWSATRSAKHRGKTSTLTKLIAKKRCKGFLLLRKKAMKCTRWFGCFTIWQLECKTSWD